MDKLNYTELAKNVCSELAIPPDAQVITILTAAFKRVAQYGSGLPDAVRQQLLDAIMKLDARLMHDHITGREIAGVHWVDRNDVVELVQRWPPQDATVLSDPCRKERP